MLHFTRRINTLQGLLSFYFNELLTATGEKRFHVSVVDKDHKVQSFAMQEQDGQWKLQNPLQNPNWIVEVEALLSQIIEEEQKKGA